jgi:hypothetical protein
MQFLIHCLQLQEMLVPKMLQEMLWTVYRLSSTCSRIKTANNCTLEELAAVVRHLDSGWSTTSCTKSQTFRNSDSTATGQDTQCL